MQAQLQILHKEDKMDITNYTGYSVDKYIKEASWVIKQGSKVLDAGAGSSPYANYFKNCIYHTADINGNPTFKCSIDNIPVPDNSYDVIICTEVLEHVKYPDKVIKEFHRILRSGGMLIMTLPQCYGEHSDDNYFNFLRNGIKLLLQDIGFININIEALGGIYTTIGKLFRVSSWYIFRQYLDTSGSFPKITAKSILLAPIFIAVLPFTYYIIPFVCYYLDKMDKNKQWTINYGCNAIKGKVN